MIIKNNNDEFQGKSKEGVTLIEMTVVILVLITLISISVSGVSSYRAWKDGTQAAQILRNVYNAQRNYLSENPTVTVANLTPAVIIPYLSENASGSNQTINAIPTMELDGVVYTVNLTVSPPVFSNGGTAFDPSGAPDDGLWDVGG